MSGPKQTPPSTLYDDEINLRELFDVLWAGKWLVAGITIVFAVVAVIGALMLPNIYRAEALLAPNNQDRAGGLSALAAQYGGLASLAGIDLGGGSTDNIALGLEILQSRKFISDFVIRHDILVPLMAAKGWDRVSGNLIVDSDDYNVAVGEWVRDVSWPKKTIPSLQEAYEEFMEIMSVRQDKASGFVTVSIDHYSPDLGKQWVDWLVADLNSSIMRQDVAEAEQAIQYLNRQIEITPLSGLKEVFFSLVEEQTKTVMLAKVTDEYLLKTLDPAVSPEEKSKPSRILIVLLSGAIGCFLGMLIVAVRGPMRSES